MKNLSYLFSVVITSLFISLEGYSQDEIKKDSLIIKKEIKKDSLNIHLVPESKIFKEPVVHTTAL